MRSRPNCWGWWDVYLPDKYFNVVHLISERSGESGHKTLLDSKLLHSFCWCNSLGETIPITKRKVIQTILLKWNACFHGPSHVCHNYRGLSVASCQVDRNQSGKKLSDFGWQDTNWLKCRVKCLVTRYAKVAMCTNMENPWCIFIQLYTLSIHKFI